MIRSVLMVVALVALGGGELRAQAEEQIANVFELESASIHLTRIEQLIADSVGGSWALDSQTPGVIRFTEVGDMLTFGRDGSGPGEFQSPWRMSLVRDTLWVVDVGLDRITGIDPITGVSLGTISGRTLWRILPEAGQQAMAPLQVTETGVLVALEEPEESMVLLVLLDRDRPGRRKDLMWLAQPDADLSIEIPGHSNPIRIPNPFSNSDLLSLDGRGRFLARVRQQPSFQAEVIDLHEDDVPVVLRWSFERREVTEDQQMAWLEGQTELARGFARRGFFASEAAAMEAIESALETELTPAVRRSARGVFERTTFIDEQGSAWFEGWSLGESHHEWYRLTPEGGALELALENGEELLGVSGRFLWKQRFDSLGVPHLTRVELAVTRSPG